MIRKVKIHHVVIVCVVTLFVLAFSVLFTNPMVDRLELLTQDLFYTVRGPEAPGTDVVIAAIDEKSIDRIGRWPWPREKIAQLLDRLKESGVPVAGFDIVFSSPERGSDGDALLTKALKRFPNTVLGYFFHFSEEGLEHLNEEELAAFVKIIARSRYTGIKKAAGVKLAPLDFRQAYAVEATIGPIAKATRNAGYFNFHPERDGSIRRVPMLVQYQDLVDLEEDTDYLFPPLSLTMLKKYLGGAIVVDIEEFGVSRVILASDQPKEIPVNDQGEMFINYYGPQHTFPYYSIVDILDGKIGREQLAGKMVLIGSSAIAIEDFRPTPFEEVFPGIEIHATILDNILQDRYLRAPQFPVFFIDIFSVLVIGLLLLFFIPSVGALGGCVVVTMLLGTTIAVHYYLFSSLLLTTHLIPALMQVALCSPALYTSRFFMEEKEKKYIRDAFGRYMSPLVIEQLIQDPSKLKLGGVRRELTAFFSDLAGFSSISEKMQPGELVHLLNEYLTEMTNIVLKYDGTLDKYEGDAIMAFWGAPLDDAGHAEKCCRVALEMQDRLAEMRTKLEQGGKPLLFARMGINTGQMVVGNMGAETRMDYTIMGDEVNLASRLEGVNKEYGTEIIISQATLDKCGDIFEVRELDSIRVMGKKQAVVIYELLAQKGAVEPEKQRIIDLYAEGLALYKKRKWHEAIEIFGRIFELDPEDGPSLTYLERCLDFRIHPPGPEWSGVHVMRSK
jgi:adenylate cyclase